MDHLKEAIFHISLLNVFCVTLSFEVGFPILEPNEKSKSVQNQIEEKLGDLTKKLLKFEYRVSASLLSLLSPWLSPQSDINRGGYNRGLGRGGRNYGDRQFGGRGGDGNYGGRQYGGRRRWWWKR